ncbi:DNA repair protein RadA [Halalkalibacterium halodurans]|uniref:DNA repair protein RadA n=1 Tax=Halalkalibacterium halodurans (strain ATCC BAA-125 / DSM 18197 / FERM 7344 / JCM 9153 / C-125) TaxID=272558 RepID=RADA_HALH5|nr:DNA repair protein RadA [Halalkalibacterium halodurans]Q9KGG1.1 RecName: Full=DNA repair protein RadA; AltName: Full=Branch migration protein RadA [Halalkalibacterium halodurans C-125]MDY7220606.1 DNA repair protein RadA [Halalkalibacterium halodurans]MDY7239845.1 DNA repair protein RadA [Halalkalibacterium halodurans]MED4081210.1 DNA repair protein RadA [Halalkalibacterium halodurans]MED4083925.1 DNA repair protein RadA [Halalkalibacterium halodurans]MED4106070.1 DNA repair protein RadA [
MAKKKTKFMCQECGYESAKWMGKCPGCQSWNSMVEEFTEVKAKSSRSYVTSGAGIAKPQPITKVEREQEPRIDTSMKELNRVLGGGIVPGSLVLVGGDPGIGKSTLLLQLSARLADLKQRVLYISGEESVKQTKIRSDRLGVLSDHLYVLAETDMEKIEQAIGEVDPTLVIIDSIQTVYQDEITSAPGSVAQVRECTASFMRIAKTTGVAIFIVGHVTKQGAIAGPKLLEHMVDSVLYFEGERHHTYRILRAVKNRFGSTNEMGIFEMKESGLEEVANPSEIFLEDRSSGVAGSTVVASMEGTRPVLVELQALISPTSFGNPRRMATGVDHNRISLLMAVLEKRVGMLLQNQDAYVNVAGGVRLDEPAIDLGIAVSIASSFRNQHTNPHEVVIGEIGLTGEVRRVSRIDQRVNEAAKLGFKRVIIPDKNLGGWTIPSTIEVIGVSTVQDALEVTLGR